MREGCADGRPSVEVDAVVRFEVEARPETPYERWPGWPQAAYLPRCEVKVG